MESVQPKAGESSASSPWSSMDRVLAVAGLVLLLATFVVKVGSDRYLATYERETDVIVLQRWADKANEGLPETVSENSEQISVTVEGETLVYTFRFLKLDASTIRESGHMEASRDSVLRDSCGSDFVRQKLLEKDFTLEYRYLDINGDAAFSVFVTTEACRKWEAAS